MALHTWLAFAMAAILIAVSPGSGAVLSMSHGASYGLRQTSVTIFGLQLGLLLVLLIAGAGVGSLLLASSVAFNIIKITGACYLIYLGWRQWSTPITTPPNPQENILPAQRLPRVLSARQRCLAGFLTNITNPKGIIFMVAILPQFISPQRPLAPQLALMAVTMSAVDLCIMHGYAWAASSLRRAMAGARFQQIQQRFFGGLLMLIGAGLLLVKRSTAA